MHKILHLIPTRSGYKFKAERARVEVILESSSISPAKDPQWKTPQDKPPE